jgi:hypothetical protein
MRTITRKRAAGNALERDAAARLTKLLGMCGSAHAGERAAAALKADTLVKSAGLTWRDAIVAAPAFEPTPPMSWRQMAKFCFERRWRLSEHEAEFVTWMSRRRGGPSDEQLEWLASIYGDLADRDGV